LFRRSNLDVLSILSLDIFPLHHIMALERDVVLDGWQTAFFTHKKNSAPSGPGTLLNVSGNPENHGSEKQEGMDLIAC
jgi:hypothetical protein